MNFAEQSIRLLSRPRRAAPGATETAIESNAIEARRKTAEPVAPSSDDLKQGLEALRERLERMSGGAGRLDDADKALLARAKSAVTALMGEGVEAQLSYADQLATEAVAISSGVRPALRCRKDAIREEDLPQDGAWRGELERWTAGLSRLLPCVGRIDIDGRQAGTGWLIRPGHIVTNRHVAQALAVDDAASALALATNLRATVDFGKETRDQNAGRRFLVERIVFAGPEWIDEEQVDHRKLDLAILKIAPISGAEEPPPLADAPRPPPGSAAAGSVVALGFPGTTMRSRLLPDTLLKLFQNDPGVKRVSPGYVSAPPGAIRGDELRRVFQHDATTLPGSSGSLIVSFDDDARWSVVGLHYGGYEEAWADGRVSRPGGNFAHAFSAMSDVIQFVDAAIDGVGGRPVPARPAAPPPPPASPAVAPSPESAEALKTDGFDLDKAVFLAKAAQAAYGDPIDVAAWTEAQGFARMEFFNHDNVQGYWCVAEEVALLVFRGTSNIGQWLRDARFLPGSHAWGLAHAGFLDGARAVEPALEKFRAAAGEKKVWIAGHSLGGALALLGAAWCRMNGLWPLAYTYGQPRVGLGDFADRFAIELPGRLWRFVNQSDVVTRVPPGVFYRHTGAVKRIVSPGVLEATRAAAEALVVEAAMTPRAGLGRRQQLAEVVAGGAARAFAETAERASVRMSLLVDVEPPPLNELEFAQLQVALGAGDPERRPSTEALEGAAPWFEDHRIENYVGLLEEIRAASAGRS